jgi:hypothetical protein
LPEVYDLDLAAVAGAGEAVDREDVGWNSAGLGVPIQRAAIADQDGDANFAHARVHRGLQRDLGADSSLVAKRQSEFGKGHGVRLYVFRLVPG